MQIGIAMRLNKFAMMVVLLAASCNKSAPQKPDPRIKELVEQIRDSEPQLSRQAVDKIGRLGPKAAPALPALIEALGDRRTVEWQGVMHSTVGSHAHAALVAVGEPAVIHLRTALRTADEERITSILNVLDQIGKPAKAALPDVKTLLDAKSERVRIHAVDAVASIIPKSDELVNLLVLRLQDESPEVRGRVVGAIGACGQYALRVIPKLIAALDDEGEHSEWVAADFATSAPNRARVADVLGRLRKDAAPALPRLQMMMRLDEDSMCRARAAVAVYQITDREDEPLDVLIQLLKNKDVAGGEVAEALAEFGPRARPAVSALIDRLMNGPTRKRYVVAGALGEINDDRAIDPLIAALQRPKVEDDEFEDKIAYVSALGMFGERAERAVPAIVEYVTATDDYIDWGDVATALGQIGPTAREALPLLRKIAKENEWDPRVPKAAMEAIRKIEGK
jgi:HEAT repeat protein